MKRDSFILYSEWWEQIKVLTDEQRGRLMAAIFAYSAEGQLPEMDPATGMCFAFIRAKLDKDATEWRKKCEARSKAGAKGGSAPRRTGAAARGKQDEANEPNACFARPRQHDNDHDYDDDYDSTLDDDDDKEAEYTGRARAREDWPEPPDPPDETDQLYTDADERVRAAYRAAFGRAATPEEVAYLSRIAVLSGMVGMIGEAIRRAAQNGATAVGKYTSRIIDEWRIQGIDTMDELEQYDALRAIAAGEISGPALDQNGALAQISANRAARLDAKHRHQPRGRASP